MPNRIVFGWLLTLSWILSWSVLTLLDWQVALEMKFNEWGDFFAGIFAPLAFLWLVIGYFQQGEELGQNTKALEQQEKALKLQVDELRQSVEQQNKAAFELRKQSELSGLMTKLAATNHVLDNIEGQIRRATSSNSAGASTKIKSLTEKQESLENTIEDLLREVEYLERKNNGNE